MKIDFSKVDEKEWTLYFRFSKSNLFINIYYTLILKEYKNKTIFVLDRILENWKDILRFIQSNPNYKTKICKLDITNFKDKDNFIVIMTWDSKNNLYFWTDSEDLIKTESIENENLNFRVWNDWWVYQIWDENVMVKDFNINIWWNTILEASAIEKYEMQKERINQLFQNSQIKKDYLFETTIYQQILVMLVTWIEVYWKTRFIELLDEKSVNDNDIINTFVFKKHKDYINELNNLDNWKQKILKILDDKRINFQNFEDFKSAFNKWFWINTWSFDNLEKIKEIFQIRHKIIHTKNDMTILNQYEMNKKWEQPKFLNNDFVKEMIKIVDNFINDFHKMTLITFAKNPKK